jgi:hypothetical protein
VAAVFRTPGTRDDAAAQLGDRHQRLFPTTIRAVEAPGPEVLE